MNKLEMVTKNQIRTDLPEFRVGDTIRVDVKINDLLILNKYDHKFE